MLQLWMVWKYLKGGGRFISWTSFLALLGLALAVGCLILAMAVVSGVESHLQKAIIDVNGHFIMMDTYRPLKNRVSLQKKLYEILPQLNEISPYVHAEGLIASKGILSGIIIHGLHLESYQKVLHFEKRVIKGHLILEDKLSDSSNKKGLAPQGLVPKKAALLGTVLADKLKLEIGDTFQIIVPKPHLIHGNSFSPRIASFYLAGTLDMGKYDYNERMVFVQDKDLQKLKRWKKGMYSGLRMKFQSDQAARKAALQIGERLGYDYIMRDWHSSNRIFFSEVAVQKWVIFIVLLFIVIVACFNVCSTLFVHVLKRFSDISMLQTLGAGRAFLVRLFISHGLFIGLTGSFMGLCLGWVLCQMVEYGSFVYIPGEIYQFDHLPTEIRFMDLFLILGITILICLISTLLPALKGSKIKPVEGLRYE